MSRKNIDSETVVQRSKFRLSFCHEPWNGLEIYSSRTFFLGLSEAWPRSQVWGSFQLQVLEKLLVQHRFLVQPPRIPGKSTALMIPQAAL